MAYHDSKSIIQNEKNQYRISANKNDSAGLLFVIYDENDTAKDLSGSTVTFSIYENMADLDTGTTAAKITKTCTNSETNTGYTEVNLTKTEMQTLSRKVYKYELRAVYTSDSSEHSINGDFRVD